MADVILYLLALVGLGTVAYGAGKCIAGWLEHVPDHLPPPRDDSRDKRREWDRIQGR